MRMPYPTIVILAALLISLSGCDNGGGSSSTTPEVLASPARVAAVNSGSSLVVTDFSENKFCQVDMDTLAVTNCFAAMGKPSGIAYADYLGGRYFVGNRSVRSVDIFDAQGNFLKHLGGKTGLFDLVNDLAVNEDDEFVYVLDSKSARIDVYDFEGNLFVSDFTSGGLERPSAIEYGKDGKIYVSDFGDPGIPGTSSLDFEEVKPSIWVFDASGSLVDTLVGATSGGMGMPGVSIFSTPQGIYLDSTNNLFVVDALSGEVQVYDMNSASPTYMDQLKVIGSLGTGDGELYYPLDVYIDEPEKDVFITDNQNGRIVVFRGGGLIP